MATNLGTGDSASFNTSNMKPANEEQIDSLWGQNMADNIAHVLWGKEQKAFDLSGAARGNSASGAFSIFAYAFWKKLPTHDTLNGTYKIAASGASPDGGTTTIYLDGTLIGDYAGGDSETPISWDQSHLNDGETYEVKAQLLVKSVSNSKATINWSMWSGTMIIP